ncbi:hypothetical protein NLM24_13095 [Nocardia zapadnayensis]|uniref:Uncharacterized protein n=1 Tax=Nocardia rhamnosiphila TaxID=426716 RepID=A0ABV2X266_9NOCA|nr:MULTISPECIES: hypothetical protein [Nocardia]MCX0271627.1 hypothetical protein [Nocardia zapadnayensis]
MTAPGIADRRNERESNFGTAEIKARIEALFDARTPLAGKDRHGNRDRDEKEP